MKSLSKSLSVIALTMLMAFNTAQAQVPTDSIVADFNEFIRLLEETHPDPYTNYGGRPFFRRAAMETRFSLIEDSVTDPNVLAKRITEFLVPLNDGHTSIMDLSYNARLKLILSLRKEFENEDMDSVVIEDRISDDSSYEGDDNEEQNHEYGPDLQLFEQIFKVSEMKMAPISFKLINDGVIVKSISTDYKNLLGSRLVAIENNTIKEICDILSKYNSAENEIGRISNLCTAKEFLNIKDLEKAIPNIRDDSISFLLINPKGKQINLTLPIYGTEWFTNEWNPSTMSVITDSIPSPLQNHYQDPFYSFVDDKKNIMYFSSKSIRSRDIFDCTDSIWEKINYEDLDIDLDEDLDKEELRNLFEEIYSDSPSFSEEFYNMLHLMKQNSSKNLIIDLRNNHGGFPAIIIPTLYLLWGDKYLKERHTFGIKFIRHLSPLVIKKYILKKSEQLNEKLNSNYLIPGDYDYMGLPGDYDYMDEYNNNMDEITDEIRDNFISHCISSIKDKLKTQHGQPVYTPEHIYVLTNPGTFSAAFHYAFYLWKMGATIVGVPSSQAPNTYMFVTPFTLPRTELHGSISNTLQMFLPVDDPRAKEFTPDLMPTYEDYKRYNFDANTELLYLLDIINGKIKRK